MNKSASRLIIVGLMLSIATLPALAVAQDQDGSPPQSDSGGMGGHGQHAPPDPQKSAARLAAKLGLTSQQQSQLVGIFQQRQQQMQALRSGGDASADRRQQMMSIQQASDSQINAILTPDQQAKYAQMKQAMKNRWQEKHASSGDSSSGNDNQQ